MRAHELVDFRVEFADCGPGASVHVLDALGNAAFLQNLGDGALFERL